MIVLSIGTFSGLYGINSTCLHRTMVLERISAKVDRIDTSGYNLYYRVANRLFRHRFPIYLPDIPKANARIIDCVVNRHYDLVWIDKGITIYKSTLEQIKKHSPETIIVGYSPDLMTVKHNQSKQFIESLPFYDIYVTTKSYAVVDMYRMGCKNIKYVGNAFQEDFHYPRNVTPEIYERLAGEVGFIGAWEQERADSIIYLANHGINIRIWGGGKWLQYINKYPTLRIEEKGLFSEEYCQSLSAFKVNLCFLRKINLDQQTTRSVEIPACQGFMLAERTSEHLELFEENKEAAYFSSNEELLEKCRYYLSHEKERVQIAINGRERCMKSGYSNKERILSLLNEILV
jgi:spore maturation protein CgeB